MQHPIRIVLANSQLFDFFFSLFWSIPPKHPSNFISLHLKGLNTPLWWNGRHSGLKILWADRSTQSELCLQTANFLTFSFLCFGASLQNIPPTSYPFIWRDWIRRYGGTGRHCRLKICRRVIFVPVRFRLAAPSGISEQFFCSEILFFWQNGENCVRGR